MTPIDLRLPQPAIDLLDAYKPDYPHHQGRPSRSSVIIHTLAQLTPTTPDQTHAHNSLLAWLNTNTTNNETHKN
jgi:hypothetical protein